MASPLRPLAVVCLAAGKGTRLAVGDDAPPKVLVECLGVPVLDHVRRAVQPLHPDETLVVVGHGAKGVERYLASSWPGARAVPQVPQNGTGHALRIALDAIPDFDGDVLLVYGDIPQMRPEDLERLVGRHRATGTAAPAATVLTGVAEEPGAIGRICRDAAGRFREIVEAQDATDRPDVLAIREFNTGLYVFRAADVRWAVEDLPRQNRQGEEYATDAVTRLAVAGRAVETVTTPEAAHLLGVNTPTDLARAFAGIRRRVVAEHLLRGVQIADVDTTVIEMDVEIEPGAIILPFTHIGRGCRIAAGARVGPFARLRGGAVLEAGAEVGNFVEVKKSTLKAGAKAKHLAYLGDATVGEQANIGCGTITANYDGTHKHPTTVGPRAHVGSGTVLVAPVEVGADATTGAGAVVLPGRDVPPGATAVGVPARVIPPRDGDEDGPSADAGGKEDS